MAGDPERTVRAGDLVGAADIARRLGVGRPQVVHAWRRRHADFPQPVAVISRVSIWAWTDVDEWARSTGRIWPPQRR